MSVWITDWRSSACQTAANVQNARLMVCLYVWLFESPTSYICSGDFVNDMYIDKTKGENKTNVWMQEKRTKINRHQVRLLSVSKCIKYLHLQIWVNGTDENNHNIIHIYMDNILRN